MRRSPIVTITILSLASLAACNRPKETPEGDYGGGGFDPVYYSGYNYSAGRWIGSALMNRGIPATTALAANHATIANRGGLYTSAIHSGGGISRGGFGSSARGYGHAGHG